MQPLVVAVRALILVLAVAFSVSWAVTPVQAADSNLPDNAHYHIRSVQLRDLDGDGRPDEAILKGAFITQNDELDIYDSHNDLPQSDDWRDLVHFDHATMVFDVGATGSAKLIVQLSSGQGGYVANVYDDRNGDGHVSYVRSGASIRVTETLHPPLIVKSPGPWLLRNGKLQGNLSFLVDGPIVSQYSLYPDAVKALLTNDGNPDFYYRVVDPSDTGNPTYAIWQLMHSLPDTYAVLRSGVLGREGTKQMSKPEGYLFWPLLGHSKRYDEGDYFDTPPTIEVDWAKAQITRVGLLGYPIERGYHINSMRPIVNGTTNEANFENPMAYYDLADNHDGRPELHIRVQNTLADDYCGYPETCRRPFEDIRYSWKQYASNALTWDFKLGLAGRHDITGVVSFPGFSIKTVPYAELPTWVAQNSWDFASFVATEGHSYNSSEGIYEWPALGTPEAGSYLRGLSTAPSVFPESKLPMGFRGEYTLDLRDKPRLYLSPIDHNLHLLKAQAGVWPIDAHDTLCYDSLGTAFISKWSLLEDGFERAVLYRGGPYIVYQGEGDVEIRQTSVPAAVSIVGPPTNHQEWLDLGNLLARNKPQFAPGDLAAMARQFGQPVLAIRGANISGFRLTGSGFRFLLDLWPGFQEQGALVDMKGLTSGQYIVTYDGRWSIQPATPPSLSTTVVPQDLVQFRPGALDLTLRNDGSEDISGAQLVTTATPPEGQPEQLASVSVEVHGRDVTKLAIPWTPGASGAWTVTAELDPDTAAPIKLGHFDVNVAPPGPAGLNTVRAITTSSWLTLLAGLVLAAFATVGGTAFWQLGVRSSTSRNTDEDSSER